MNRSLIITPLIAILVSLAGCRAQSERRSLQNSVTRLEQRLKNLDTYLESLKKGQKEQTTQQASAIQNKEREAQKLRNVIEQQEAAISKEREQLDRERAKMRADLQKAKNDMLQSQESMRERMATEIRKLEAQIAKANAQSDSMASLMEKERHQAEAAAEQFKIQETAMRDFMETHKRATAETQRMHEEELRNVRAVIEQDQKKRADARSLEDQSRALEHDKLVKKQQAGEKVVESLKLQLAQQNTRQQLANELADRLALLEARLAQVTRHNTDYRNRTDQITEELKTTKSQLVEAQGAAKRLPAYEGNEVQGAIASLTRERKEIARLRATIQRDLAKARQNKNKQESDAVMRLKAENSVLIDKLRELEARLQSPKSEREDGASTKTHAGTQTHEHINNPKTITLNGTHTSTTVSTGSAHEPSSRDAHGKSNHAINGVDTLIIHAGDGTVHIHIYDAAPNIESDSTPKARSGFGGTSLPTTKAPLLPVRTGGKPLGAKARASLMMARDAFQTANPSKTADKQKATSKKASKTDSSAKKLPSKKINDLMLPI